MEHEQTNPASAVDVKLVSTEQLEIDVGRDDRAPRSRIRRRYVLGGLIALAVMVLIAGAVSGVVLSLHSGRGDGLQVPHTFSVSFSANAAPGTSNPGVDVPYTGRLHKTMDAEGNWVLTGIVEYTQADVKTVNNRAFYTSTNTTTGTMASSGCLERADLPPYADLQAAFDSATPLSAQEEVVDHLEAKCEQHEKYVITWAGEAYVVCALPGNDGASYEFVGEEFSADLFDIQTSNPTPVDVPTGAAGSALSCPELAPMPVASSRLLRGSESEADADMTWYLKSTHEARHARRLGSKKKCVFMHGLGHANNMASTSTHDYWGNVHKYANCKSFTFVRRDTKNTAWDDPALLQHFCNEAGGSVISDTYVFSHSMGSLIVAGALQSGKCRLASSSKWFQVQGPVAGSRAADYATSVCANGNSVVGAILRLTGMCSGASIQSLKTSRSNPRISYSSLVSTIRNNADGVMCGTSAWGLNTWTSPAFAIVEGIIKFSGSSDAIVGFNSCDTGAPGSFGTSYKNKVYKPAVNHFDGTCRNGNGWWGKDRKPCKWFDKMT